MQLAAKLDTEAAPALLADLRDACGFASSLTLDGSAVQSLGQASLQVLLACARDLAADGGALVIAVPSAALIDAAEVAGASELLNLARAARV